MGRIQGAAASIPSVMERVAPQSTIPSPDQSRGNYQTRLFTYLTAAGGAPAQLYNAGVEWSRVRLRLTTAGPVVVGTTQAITPVLSGKGLVLPTGEWVEFEVSKGNNVWIASNTIDRVSVIIQPIGWAEQILGAVMRGIDGLAQILNSMRPK